MHTEEFANSERRGLRVTPYSFLRQFESYLKGLYLHQSGFVNEALINYTNALCEGGHYSVNQMRLNSLEAIDLIIREKTTIERRHLGRASARDSVRARAPEVVGWRKLNSIHKYLSHHYIVRRSVVFIVDSQYDSMVYREMAMRYASKFYKSLDDEDHFGFI